MNRMDVLYDWVFHYNPHIGKWEAVKREHYFQLFSGGNDKIMSSSILTLIELVSKTSGDVSLLNELTKSQ